MPNMADVPSFIIRSIIGTLNNLARFTSCYHECSLRCVPWKGFLSPLFRPKDRLVSLCPGTVVQYLSAQMSFGSGRQYFLIWRSMRLFEANLVRSTEGGKRGNEPEAVPTNLSPHRIFPPPRHRRNTSGFHCSEPILKKVKAFFPCSFLSIGL